jgi:hypothetical protein
MKKLIKIQYMTKNEGSIIKLHTWLTAYVQPANHMVPWSKTLTEKASGAKSGGLFKAKRVFVLVCLAILSIVILTKLVN